MRDVTLFKQQLLQAPFDGWQAFLPAAEPIISRIDPWVDHLCSTYSMCDDAVVVEGSELGGSAYDVLRVQSGSCFVLWANYCRLLAHPNVLPELGDCTCMMPPPVRPLSRHVQDALAGMPTDPVRLQWASTLAGWALMHHIAHEFRHRMPAHDRYRAAVRDGALDRSACSGEDVRAYEGDADCFAARELGRYLRATGAAVDNDGDDPRPKWLYALAASLWYIEIGTQGRTSANLYPSRPLRQSLIARSICPRREQGTEREHALARRLLDEMETAYRFVAGERDVPLSSDQRASEEADLLKRAESLGLDALRDVARF